jgi:hypothetical protein
MGKEEDRMKDQSARAITKARKLENTKKGGGVNETLFFRAFVTGSWVFILYAVSCILCLNADNCFRRMTGNG